MMKYIRIYFDPCEDHGPYSTKEKLLSNILAGVILLSGAYLFAVLLFLIIEKGALCFLKIGTCTETKETISLIIVTILLIIVILEKRSKYNQKF